MTHNMYSESYFDKVLFVMNLNKFSVNIHNSNNCYPWCGAPRVGVTVTCCVISSLLSATSTYRNFGFGSSPLAYTLMCDGSEKDIAQCRMLFIESCSRYKQVNIVCSMEGMISGIHISTMDSESVSILENVVMSNISGIQVSGTPPSVVNVTLEDTTYGFAFVGQGELHTKDIHMHNVTVKKVRVIAISTCMIDIYIYIYTIQRYNFNIFANVNEYTVLTKEICFYISYCKTN